MWPVFAELKLEVDQKEKKVAKLNKPLFILQIWTLKVKLPPSNSLEGTFWTLSLLRFDINFFP